jgi:hypothetical protein
MEMGQCAGNPGSALPRFKWVRAPERVAMNARKLLTIAVAATLLVGGMAGAAAAMPGNGPTDDDTPGEANTPGNSGDTPGQAGTPGNSDDTPDNDEDERDETETAANGTDAADEADSENETDSQNETERGPGNAPEQAGPPTDMPDAAPDKVTEIHATINAFLDGEVEHLGDALSDLFAEPDADEESEDSTSDEQTTSENETTTTTDDQTTTTTDDSDQTTTTTTSENETTTTTTTTADGSA